MTGDLWGIGEGGDSLPLRQYIKERGLPVPGKREKESRWSRLLERSLERGVKTKRVKEKEKELWLGRIVGFEEKNKLWEAETKDVLKKANPLQEDHPSCADSQIWGQSQHRWEVKAISPLLSAQVWHMTSADSQKPFREWQEWMGSGGDYSQWLQGNAFPKGHGVIGGILQ